MTARLCDTWDEFIRLLREPIPPAEFLYRGQAVPDWKLSSILERWLRRSHEPGVDVDKELGGRAARKELLAKEMRLFKSIALTHPAMSVPLGNQASDALWYALARQHGVASPLLDWTRNPFVGAFFAAVDAMDNANRGFRFGSVNRLLEAEEGGGWNAPDEPFVVWRLQKLDAVWESGVFEEVDPVELRDARLHSQEGTFTMLTHAIHLDVESYLADRRIHGVLTKYEIAGSEAGTALGDLHRMGLRLSRLYPDLDGVGLEANHGREWEYLSSAAAAIARRDADQRSRERDS